MRLSTNPRRETERREIYATLYRLLTHYWQNTELDAARRGQIEDLLEDVAEFGAATVLEICREWRRTRDRAPMPSELRRLCIQAQSAEQDRRVTAGGEDMDAYARSVGFADNAERMQEIRKAQARRDDPADWDRLKRIKEEIQGYRVGGMRPAHHLADAVAAALGTQVERDYTPEEMRRARIELGIEPAPPLYDRERRDSVADAREPLELGQGLEEEAVP
jgi:hypothetical protein